MNLYDAVQHIVSNVPFGEEREMRRALRDALENERRRTEAAVTEAERPQDRTPEDMKEYEPILHLNDKTKLYLKPMERWRVREMMVQLDRGGPVMTFDINDEMVIVMGSSIARITMEADEDDFPVGSAF